jgi:sugar lactone lactonase YvrE
VSEGGEVLQTVEVDRGCFACMLGGSDGGTLFIAAQEWNGPGRIGAGPRSGQILAIEAPAPRAGHP